MLVILPPTSLNINERETTSVMEDQSADFPVDSFLETLDFDDFFVGINDADLLPCLQMDSQFFPEFSVPDADISAPIKDENTVGAKSEYSLEMKKKHIESSKSSNKEERSTSSVKNLAGKKKVKVDWTPDLHRRFVQAVEQLGLEKAVPSRILELMDIDCLTRHNVASHLQKYRSHRKHLQAREAEAANWNQRRQLYGTPGTGSSGSSKKSPWVTPSTMGFPPMASFRPLHVWGHPSVDQSYSHMWQPKHLSSQHAWPALPSTDSSLWIPHQHVPPQGTPCFSPSTRLPTVPLPCTPAPPPNSLAVPALHHGQTLPQPPHIHPSAETIDAAIGDVLSKPWMPLPLGLKPPSVDSVMIELQRQGISKIPTSFA